MRKITTIARQIANTQTEKDLYAQIVGENELRASGVSFEAHKHARNTHTTYQRKIRNGKLMSKQWILYKHRATSAQ